MEYFHAHIFAVGTSPWAETSWCIHIRDSRCLFMKRARGGALHAGCSPLPVVPGGQLPSVFAAITRSSETTKGRQRERQRRTVLSQECECLGLQIVVSGVPGHAQGASTHDGSCRSVRTAAICGRRTGARVEAPVCRTRSPRTVEVLRVGPMTPGASALQTSRRKDRCPQCVPPQASRWCIALSPEPVSVRRLCSASQLVAALALGQCIKHRGSECHWRHRPMRRARLRHSPGCSHTRTFRHWRLTGYSC